MYQVTAPMILRWKRQYEKKLANLQAQFVTEERDLFNISGDQ